jgi:hypothetical protein
MTSYCTAFNDIWEDDFDVVRFDDKPLQSIDALKLHRRSAPQWLFFVSSQIVDSNNTALMEWEFTSHMTITPEQCYQVADIIQMLDDALQRANPTVSNITSSAIRLGAEECEEDDQCPCDEEPENRRVLISHLLLEAKTRSNAPGLKPPMEFPLRVADFSTY